MTTNNSNPSIVTKLAKTLMKHPANAASHVHSKVKKLITESDKNRVINELYGKVKNLTAFKKHLNRHDHVEIIHVIKELWSLVEDGDAVTDISNSVGYFNDCVSGLRRLELKNETSTIDLVLDILSQLDISIANLTEEDYVKLVKILAKFIRAFHMQGQHMYISDLLVLVKNALCDGSEEASKAVRPGTPGHDAITTLSEHHGPYLG